MKSAPIQFNPNTREPHEPLFKATSPSRTARTAPQTKPTVPDHRRDNPLNASSPADPDLALQSHLFPAPPPTLNSILKQRGKRCEPQSPESHFVQSLGAAVLELKEAAKTLSAEPESSAAMGSATFFL
jgi:hypothetical protein